MKKYLLLLLGYLTCASPGQAQNVSLTDSNTGLQYILSKSGTTCQAVLSGFDAANYSRPAAIIVPSSLPYDGDDYTVMGINTNFQDWTELRGVALPPTVTSISMRCFKGCSNLQIANLEYSGLLNIPLEAFQGCTSLTEVEIPATVSQLRGSAFYNCTSLSSVTLNEGLQYIGWGAFANCDLREVTIPSTVTLAAIDIPELPTAQQVQYQNTASGELAFYNNKNLTSVTFNNVPTFIGVRMFEGCTNLTTVTFTQTTPPALMASDAFPTDHAITVKVPEGCRSAYAAKFSAYSNITVQEDGPARRFIRVNDVNLLQPGGEYAVACVGTNTTYYPRYYQLNSSNQLAGPKISDEEITSDMIWTFHEVENKTNCANTSTGHNVGPMFAMSKTVNGEERYAQFGSAATTTTYSTANDFELCPAQNTTAINDETGLYFVLHTNRNANGSFGYVRGIRSDGDVTQTGFSAWYELTNWSGSGYYHSTVHKVYLAVTEGKEAIAARALWNAKAEEFRANNAGIYSDAVLNQCLAFPEDYAWSYDNLETQVAELFEAGKPQVKTIRVENDYQLIDNCNYAIGTIHSQTFDVADIATAYHPRFFDLNASNQAVMTGVTTTESFPPSMIWTMHRADESHNCTNTGDAHKGQVFTFSNNDRYARFGSTTTDAASSISNQCYGEFVPKEITGKGVIFKIHYKKSGAGTAYDGAAGYNYDGNAGTFSKADAYDLDELNDVSGGVNRRFALTFQVYHVVKSWAPGESAPYFWQVKRNEVEASDFTPELKQEILAATATMPEYAWSYVGIETEVAEQFDALAAPVIAAHLESITNDMIDEHFSGLKTWVDANKTEWSEDLTTLINDTKKAAKLSEGQTWTSEAIIEHVSGKYAELGIVNLEDMFTRLIAGKTYNLVSPHFEYEGNAVATNLEYNTTNNKARLIFDATAGYTGFAFEAKEDATGLLIKEVATGKYMKVAPTGNNVGIEFSADIDEAGTYYVKNAAADTESLLIWGEGSPNRFLHCNANTASTANTLFTYTGTSLQNQWNLHKTTDLAAYNAALKEETNKKVAEIEEYSTYGTKEFVTEEAIAAAAVNYCDEHEFTEADELTPATFAAKLEALAEYTYEKQDELWSGASLNGKNLLLLTGRAVSENRYLKAENNALAAPQNGVSAESVWNFEHAGGNMYRIYNPETGAYVKADRSLTVQPEATEEGEEETEWNAADEAELFYFAKSTAANGDAANAICICSSSTAGDLIALHKNSGANDNMMYWRVNDMASEFFVKLADEDLAAAAKLPFPAVTYPDFNTYKTWNEPGYKLGGYDPALQADAVYATTHIPTEAELAEYVDNSNICSDNLIEVLHGRNTQVDKINAFLASKAFPQDGMYITITSSPNNGIGSSNVATLYDNDNERADGTTVSTSGNCLRMTASDAHPITEFNKIWYYKGGKMYSYATGHYLQGATGGGDAKRHLTISKDTEHEETAEAAEAAATEITFVNAHEEVNEFQMLHTGVRAVHIAVANGVCSANTCGGTANTTFTTANNAMFHNIHIDLVEQLPIEVHADGFGSFAGHVAFQIPENSNYTYYRATATDDGKILFDEVDGGTKFTAGNVLIVENNDGVAGTAYVKVLYNADESELIGAHGIDAINATHVALSHADAEGKTTFAKTDAATTSGTLQVRARVAGDGGSKAVTMQPVGNAKPVNVLTVEVDSDNPNIDEDGNLVMPLGVSVATGIEAIELRRADGTSTVYDLQGRRMAAPRKGAVNIVNGKKVYVAN